MSIASTPMSPPVARGELLEQRLVLRGLDPSQAASRFAAMGVPEDDDRPEEDRLLSTVHAGVRVVWRSVRCFGASFGVWVHRDLRQILTFAEGDITVVECPDDAAFRAEIESMERLYGEPPPAAKAIEADGSITNYYSARLSAATLCLAFLVSLLSGCRGGPVKAPEPAEITNLTCGRSCLVSQAGPSTVVWVGE